ncbi:sugar kinase [Massilia sp. WF1]|uniref:carbohydrate kinase family protein n=1 Tax=unclassified Massilia TaxID=2609279 RepID=UPI00064B59CF|nr:MULTISPECIES: carbohydrate kinase [unclassified Massilia]ALK99351.1 sugar kinase [Massilia sp. WG5]KLU35326.1 sugar kinase [Massilia sp. WF1]
MNDVTTNTTPLMLCAGEALTDMIDQGGERWVSRVGGSVWNVARALAVLGEPTAFAGAISRDRFGDALWAASEEVGLDLRLLQRVERSPLLAVVEKCEPPRYFFIGDDSADLHFDPAQLPAGWADSLRWAHFGGISLAREPLAATLVALAAQLKEKGVAISYDPNYRKLMDERYTPTLERMAGLADVIKVSDDDLRGLFPKLELDQALQRVRAFNPAAYCLLTRGGEGASLYHGAQRCDARAPRVEVVDTVGAGDASVAGLLHSLARHPGRPLLSHLHAALAAGSAACLQAGATPPPPAAMHRLFELLQGETS